jgi:TolA-binding protein
LVMAVGVAAGGCSQLDQLERDVRGLERKLSDLRNFQAEQTTEISSIESRLRDLSGRVDVLEHAQTVRAPAGVPEERPAQPLQVPPPVVPLSALQADETLAAGLPRAGAAREFSEALAEIRAGKFQQALPRLQRAQEQNYGEEGTAEIIFWKGVCYDGVGDNRRALAAYGEVIASYPKASRAALALLRQASVFIRLGDIPTARLSFDKLIAEFPQSAEAATARQRLKDL